MSITPGPILSDLRVAHFTPEYAPLVASWAPAPSDLFWLAPATPPPLTAEKVRAWTAERDNPLLLWQVNGEQPIGYSELNLMQRDQREMWVGHFIVSPAHRGRGLGVAFMEHLMRLAFAHFGAERVSLVVFPENTAAVNCYLRSGLVRTGVEVKTFDHAPGRHQLFKMGITHKLYQHRQSPKVQV